jgi:surfeit locus 1 family protein
MHIRILNTKFQLIPLLFTLPTFLFLIYLGCWQLERLSDKKAKITELQEKSDLPAIQLPIKLDDLTSFRYRKVKASGEYMHDKEIFLYAGSRSHKQGDGFMILTPLKTLDGRVVIVNRGWIPSDVKSQANRVDTLEAGIVEVIGYVMLGEEKSWIIPENNDKKNIWFNINLEQMQNFVGAKIESYYIMRVFEGNEYPIGNNLNVNLRNNHLEYAITWFTSAFTLLTIFILYHKRREDK